MILARAVLFPLHTLATLCADDNARAREIALSKGIAGRGCNDLGTGQYCNSVEFHEEVQKACPHSCGICLCGDDDDQARAAAQSFGLASTSCVDLSSFCDQMPFRASVQNICPATCGFCQPYFSARLQLQLALRVWTSGTRTSLKRVFGHISTWNVSAVTNMRYLLNGAGMRRSFNAPIGSWETSQVTNMQAMFKHTSSFDQSLAKWNT